MLWNFCSKQVSHLQRHLHWQILLQQKQLQQLPVHTHTESVMTVDISLPETYNKHLLQDAKKQQR